MHDYDDYDNDNLPQIVIDAIDALRYRYNNFNEYILDANTMQTCYDRALFKSQQIYTDTKALIRRDLALMHHLTDTEKINYVNNALNQTITASIRSAENIFIADIGNPPP